MRRGTWGHSWSLEKERERKAKEGEPVVKWFPVPIKTDLMAMIQPSDLRAKNNYQDHPTFTIWRDLSLAPKQNTCKMSIKI